MKKSLTCKCLGRLLPPEAKGLEGGEFSGLDAIGDKGLLKKNRFGLFGVKSDGSGCKGAECTVVEVGVDMFDSSFMLFDFPVALKITDGSLLPLSRSEAVDILIIPLAFIVSLKVWIIFLY